MSFNTPDGDDLPDLSKFEVKKARNPYRNLVEDSAARHGVDPDFIEAMMSQESAFNPNAKSHKNAEGLMQMIPATAARFDVTDVYDPKQNIEGGTKYAKWLLDRFKGDVDKALAGYNAGEGAVDKYNGIPPYRETQDYVKKIRSKYKGGGYAGQNSNLPDLSQFEVDSTPDLSQYETAPAQNPQPNILANLNQQKAQLEKDFQAATKVKDQVAIKKSLDLLKVSIQEESRKNQPQWQTGGVNDVVLTPTEKSASAPSPTNPTNAMPPSGEIPSVGEPSPIAKMFSDKVILSGENGARYVQIGDQSGLQENEVRVRNTANDKGGVVIARKITNADGTVSFQIPQPNVQGTQSNVQANRQKPVNAGKIAVKGTSQNVQESGSAIDATPEQLAEAAKLYQADDVSQFEKGFVSQEQTDDQAGVVITPDKTNVQMKDANIENIRNSFMGGFTATVKNPLKKTLTVNEAITEAYNQLPETIRRANDEVQRLTGKPIFEFSQESLEAGQSQLEAYGELDISYRVSRDQQALIDAFNRGGTAELESALAREKSAPGQLAYEQYAATTPSSERKFDVAREQRERAAREQIRQSIVADQNSFLGTAKNVVGGIVEEAVEAANPIEQGRNILETIGLIDPRPQTSAVSNEIAAQDEIEQRLSLIQQTYGSFENYQKKMSAWDNFSSGEKAIRYAGYFGTKFSQGVVDSVKILPMIYQFSSGGVFGADKNSTVEENEFYKFLDRAKKEFYTDEFIDGSASGEITGGFASATQFLLGGYAMRGSKIGTAILGMSAQVPSMYEQMRQRGITPDDALFWSFVAGVPLGASEIVGVGGQASRTFKQLALGSQLKDSTMKAWMKGMAQTTLRDAKNEAVEEFSQELFQNATGDALVNTLVRDDLDGLQKILEFSYQVPKTAGEAVPQALIAGLTGGVFGGGGAVLTEAVNQRNSPERAERKRRADLAKNLLPTSKININGEIFDTPEAAKSNLMESASSMRDAYQKWQKANDLFASAKKAKTFGERKALVQHAKDLMQQGNDAYVHAEDEAIEAQRIAQSELNIKSPENSVSMTTTTADEANRVNNLMPRPIEYDPAANTLPSASETEQTPEEIEQDGADVALSEQPGVEPQPTKINAGNSSVNVGDKVKYFDEEDNRVRTGTVAELWNEGSNGGSNVYVEFDDEDSRGYSNRMVAPSEIENISVSSEVEQSESAPAVNETKKRATRRSGIVSGNPSAARISDIKGSKGKAQPFEFKKAENNQTETEVKKLDNSALLEFKPVKSVEEIFSGENTPLSDILEAANGYYDAIDRTENLEKEIKDLKNKKSSAAKENKKAIQDEIDEKQAEIYSITSAVYRAQDQFGNELADKLVEIAKSKGYELDEDERNDLAEYAVPYLTDGRYMENVYGKVSVQDFSNELVDDYLAGSRSISKTPFENSSGKKSENLPVSKNNASKTPESTQITPEKKSGKYPKHIVFGKNEKGETVFEELPEDVSRDVRDLEDKQDADAERPKLLQKLHKHLQSNDASVSDLMNDISNPILRKDMERIALSDPWIKREQEKWRKIYENTKESDNLPSQYLNKEAAKWLSKINDALGKSIESDNAIDISAKSTDSAHDAATSPTNDLPEPTKAQIEAGNYKKGHITVGGISISVENPVGSARKGVDESGKAWSVTMQNHYGYIKRSVGADTENIDVFVKDGTPENYSGNVFVVDQVNPETGKFDEHKVMLGFADEAEARAAYASNYEKDWKGLKSITAFSFDQFKDWTKSEQKSPAAKTKNADTRTVHVNGFDITLTPEQNDRWTKEVEPLEARNKKHFDSQMQQAALAEKNGNRIRANVIREDANREAKGDAMKLSALKREIADVQTEKERFNREKREKSNYPGKKVSFGGKNAIVQGAPFGKVTVEFADGTRQTVPRDEIKPPIEEKVDISSTSENFEKKPEYRFSSTQANLTGAIKNKILQLGNSLIDEADLAEDGREEQPHITILYGVHSSKPAEVQKVLETTSPFEITLGKVEIFPGKKDKNYDVVKVAVVLSPELRAVNELLAKSVKNTQTFPDYKPHITLAYVKKGAGKKYAGSDKLAGTTIEIESIVFSSKTGEQTEIKLEGNLSTKKIGKTNEKLKSEISMDEVFEENFGNKSQQAKLEKIKRKGAIVVSQNVNSDGMLHVKYRRESDNPNFTPREMSIDKSGKATPGTIGKTEYKKPRTAPTADVKKHSLSQFIRMSGGIRQSKVIDLSAIENAESRTKKGKKKSGFASLIRPSGSDIEDVFRSAVESGYLTGLTGEYNQSENYDRSAFSVDDFVEAVADDMRTGKYISSQSAKFDDKSIENAQAEYYAKKIAEEKSKAGLESLSDEEFYGQKTIEDFLADDEVRQILLKSEELGKISDKDRDELFQIGHYDKGLEQTDVRNTITELERDLENRRNQAESAEKTQPGIDRENAAISDAGNQDAPFYRPNEQIDESEPDGDVDLSFDFSDESIPDIFDNALAEIKSEEKSKKYITPEYTDRFGVVLESGKVPDFLADKFKNSPTEFGKEINSTGWYYNQSSLSSLIYNHRTGQMFEFTAKDKQNSADAKRFAEQYAEENRTPTAKTQNSFDQTDLFGNKQSAKTEQIGLFGTADISESFNQANIEATRAVFGNQTADFIGEMLHSKDKSVERVASEIVVKGKLVESKGDGAKQIIEDVSDALELFRVAKEQKTTVNEVLLQPRLDGVKFSEKASDFARAMESGKFESVFGKSLSEVKTESFKFGDRVRLPDGSDAIFQKKIGNDKAEVISDGAYSTVLLKALKNDDETLKKARHSDEISLENLYNNDGDFDYESVKNIAGRIGSGELEITRLAPREEQGRGDGGQRNVEASIIAGAEERAIREASQGREQTREEVIKNNRQIEDRLEEYARREKIWFDYDEFTNKHPYFAKGEEARIFEDENPAFVLKIVDYSYFSPKDSPLKFIDERISLFNYLFPETKYELVGFTRDENGRFQFILRQPYIIAGKTLTPRKVSKFMSDILGADSELTTEQFANREHHVSDLHLENIVQDRNGNIFVIDAMTELTPARLGGVREYKDFSVRKADNETLKKNRTPEISSAVSEIEGADLNELLKVVEPKEGIERDDYRLSFSNVETFEIVRRAVEAYDLEANPTKTNRSRFDGLFLNPAEIRGVVNVLRKGARFASRNSGLNLNERRKLIEIAREIKLAARAGGGTAIISIFDDAVAHEEVHRISFVEAADKRLSERHSKENLKTLAEHPTAQKIQKGAFSKLYLNVSKPVLVEEINTWLLSGQRDELNKIQREMGLEEISEDEADSFLVDWLASYNQQNPNADLSKFAAVSEFANQIYEQSKRIETKNSSGSESDRRIAETPKPDRQERASENSQKTEAGSRSETNGQAEKLNKSFDSEIEETISITGETQSQVKTKNRKFAESLAVAFYDFGAVEYEAQSENKWFKQSQKDIENLGVEKAIEKYDSLDPKLSEGYKTALGASIASELYANGTRAEFTDFGRKLSEHIGSYAQELRATQLLSRLSPEYAAMVANAKKEKATGKSLTDEESDTVHALAVELKNVSDDLDSANAIIEDSAQRLKEYDLMVSEINELLESESKRSKNLSKDLGKAQRQVSYYKNIVESGRVSRNRQNIAKLKKEVAEKSKDYSALLEGVFGDKPLMMAVFQPSKIEDLSATSPLQNKEVFDALVNLAAVKLDNELPNGLTVEQFDKYLDGLTNNSLVEAERNLIHASAWDIISTSKPVSDKTKAILKNRAEHGKRAAAVLNADARAQAASNKQNLKDHKAFQYDKFARLIVSLAQSINAKPETVFVAFAMREFGNEQAVRDEAAEQFSKLDSKELNKVFVEAKNLLELAKEELLKARKKAFAEKRKISLEEAENLSAEKKDLEIRQRKAKRNLELFLKDLTLTKTQKFLNSIEKVYNIPRSFGFSGDAGFLGRQGGKAAVISSSAWWSAKNNLIPALADKEKLERHLHDLYKSEMRKLSEVRGAKYKHIGEKQYVYEDWANSLFEEGFDRTKGNKATKAVKTVVNTITFVPRRSNAAHGAFLDELRLKIFEEVHKHLEDMQKRGKITDAQMALSEEFFAQKFAPVISGQGYGGKFDNVLNILAAVPFAAPRLRLSHFQFLYYMNPVRSAFLPKGARKIVYQKQLRFYAPVLTFIAFGMAAGLIGDDEEDSDFLKVKGDKLAEWTGWSGFKDMRFDLSGGAKEAWRTIFLGAEKIIYSTVANNPQKLESVNKELYQMFVTAPSFKDEKYSGEQIGSFWRYALHPSLNIARSWWNEQDPIGQPYHKTEVVRDFILPLPVRQVGESVVYDTPERDQTGADVATRLFFTVLFEESGIGVQSFRKRDKEVNAKKDLVEQVDSGKVSIDEAKKQLKDKVKSGELTIKEATNLQKNLLLSSFERTAKNLDAADDKDFEKIENFIKEVPESEREKVRKILVKKYQNKLKGQVDIKTRNQATRLKEIIDKNLIQ